MVSIICLRIIIHLAVTLPEPSRSPFTIFDIGRMDIGNSKQLGNKQSYIPQTEMYILSVGLSNLAAYMMHCSGIPHMESYCSSNPSLAPSANTEYPYPLYLITIAVIRLLYRVSLTAG